MIVHEEAEPSSRTVRANPDRTRNPSAFIGMNLRNQNDLTLRARFEDAPVRLRGGSQGQLDPDSWHKAAIRQTSLERRVDLDILALGHPSEEDAPDAGPAGHEVPGIDLNVPAASDHSDYPARCQQLQIVAEVHVGQHLQDDIETPVGRCLQDLPLIIGRLVIETMPDAFLLQ